MDKRDFFHQSGLVVMGDLVLVVNGEVVYF